MRNSEIVDHFKMQGFARSTIYATINRLKTSESIKDKKRTGRPSAWTGTRCANLKRLVNNRFGMGIRRLGRKFGVTHANICQKLAKMNIKYRKRTKTPKYNAKQQLKARKRSRRLVNQFYGTGIEIVMDDEKYFRFDSIEIPANAGFYTDDIKKCPESVKFFGKEKYAPKLLVWLALSPKGISQPVVRRTRSCAVNQDTYINECLKPKLLPFLRKHHADSNYIFWPDLAKPHYSKTAIAWMRENVNFVEEEDNPPNVPQARPIENFWGCLAQKVYAKGWQAKTEDQLIRRIKNKLKEFDEIFLQSLMEGVTAKLRNIADKGVFHYLKK
jgi:transposase